MMADPETMLSNMDPLDPEDYMRLNEACRLVGATERHRIIEEAAEALVDDADYYGYTIPSGLAWAIVTCDPDFFEVVARDWRSALHGLPVSNGAEAWARARLAERLAE